MTDFITTHIEFICVSITFLISSVWAFFRPHRTLVLLPIIFGALTWYGLMAWHKYTYVYVSGGADFYGFAIMATTFFSVCASIVGLLVGLGAHFSVGSSRD